MTGDLIIEVEDGPWTFPATVECLPKEAKSYAEKVCAPWRQYIRTDLAAAQVAEAYEVAAETCHDIHDDGLKGGTLTAEEAAVAHECEDEIFAKTPADAIAARDADRKQVCRRALREATVMELLEELKSRHDPPVTVEEANMIEKGQNHE